MSDDTAVTSLIIDASGAKQGAADFQAAGEQVISVNNNMADVIDAVTKRIATSTSSQTNYLNRLAGAYDPLGAAVSKATATIDKLNDIAAQGGPNAQKAADLISGATLNLNKALTAQSSATDGVSESSKAASFVLRDFGIQAEQFFSQVATGQNALTAFIQQAHGLGDAALSSGGGLAALKLAAGALLSPTGLAIEAVAALVVGTVALGAASETAARQNETLQNQLRATRGDYTALATEVTAAAKAVASTTDISTVDARAAGQTIAASPNFSGTQQQLQDLIVTSSNLAQVMDTTVVNAAKELAAALEEPGTEAEALATKHFPGMTQALADSIKQMSDSGDKADAFAKVLAVIQADTSTVTDAQTPLQKALTALSDAFTKTGQDGRSFSNVLGGAITDAAATAVNAIASVVSGLENMRQSAGTPTGTTGFNINAPPTSASSGNVLQGPPVTHMVNGQLVTENAQGIMQVLPSTGAGMGYSLQQLQTPGGNIQAGLQYLQQQYLASQGNIPAALAQYGGYGSNVSGAAGYIGSVQSQNISNLPQTVAQAIQFWGNYYHLPPQWIALGQQLAMQESNGQQFTGGVGTASPSDLTIPGSAGALLGSGVGGLPPAVTAASTSLQAQIDAGTKLATSINDLDTQIAENQAKQAALQQAIAAAQQLGQPDQVAADTKALAELQGQALSLVDAQTKLKQAAEDQLAPLQAQAGFARDMATIENNAMLAARAHGQAIDQVTLSLTKQAEAIKLAGQFNDLVTATDQQTDAQLRINAAYDGTQDSLTHAQNAEKAYAQSILDFAPGSQAQIDAAAKYTAALDAGSAATEDLQQRQQALQDLSGAFTQAFDQIGQGITNSLLQGTGAAVNWGNVMTAVAQQVLQEFLKLAVLQPILNSLFGQHGTTLTGALGALGSLGGSSSAPTGAEGVAASAASANAQASGGTVGGTLLSDGGTLLSVGKALFPDLGSSGGSSGFLSGLTDSIGLTGQNGVLSGLTSLLNTPILGTGALTGATTDALSGLGSGVFGPATAAQVGIPGLTVGPLLGAAGAGFGAGSLAGGFVQSALNKTGPGPEVGAALGTAAGIAGVALAPETFGVSLLLAGLLGGTGGGLLGGAIGPRPRIFFGRESIV